MDVQLKVHGVLADPGGEDLIAILKGETGNSILPIWIGVAEGNAIRLGLENITPERPMSHELLKSILDSLRFKLEKVVLKENRSNLFFAKLYLKKATDESLVIDAVPGDAIALALRADTPIFASDELIEQSGAKNLDKWLESLHERGNKSYDA